MMNLSKVFCFKLLFCATIMVFALSSPVQAETSNGVQPILDLLPKDDSAGKTMKSTSFKSYKKKKKKEAAEEEEDKPELEDIEEADLDESAESIAEQEKSPEQKLWDKYKAMKANAKKEAGKEKKSASKSKKKKSKQSDNKNDNAENYGEYLDDDTDLSDADVEEDAEEETSDKKKNTGIVGIIEDYKNSQKGKGGLNTRSFGSID